MRPSHLETRYKYDLSPRQREVLELIARGRTNAEIAAELGITLDGAKYHVREILGKLGVESREEAAAKWRRMRSPMGRVRQLAVVGLGVVSKGGPVLAAVGAAVAVAVGIGTLVLLAGGGDDDAPASAEPTPTTTLEPEPVPSPTPDGSLLPPCDADSAGLSLELVPDGENVRIQLNVAGMERCRLGPGAARLHIIAAPGAAGEELPRHANMDRRFKVALDLPFSGTLVEWSWGNWCGPEVAHVWEVVIGEAGNEVRATVAVDTFPACVTDLAPTAARLETITTGADGEIFPWSEGGQCEGLRALWAGWACEWITRVGIDASHGGLTEIVAVGMPERVVCTGDGQTEQPRAAELCDGARPGEQRIGYPFLHHKDQGNNVVLLSPAEFLALLDGPLTGEPAAVPIGLGGPDGMEDTDTLSFLIMFGQPGESDVSYLVFRMEAAREPALIAGGVTEIDPGIFFGGGQSQDAVEMTTVMGLTGVFPIWVAGP